MQINMNLYHLMFYIYYWIIIIFFCRISLIITSSYSYDISFAIIILFFSLYLLFAFYLNSIISFCFFFILFCTRTVHIIRSCIFLYTIRTLNIYIQYLKGKLWWKIIIGITCNRNCVLFSFYFRCVHAFLVWNDV